MALIAVGCAVFASCGSAGVPGPDPVRAAPEAPESFSAVFAPEDGSEACQSRLVDPQQQVELILVRSQDWRGDYLVPVGQYGAAADELIRIDCRTGRVIGFVKKY